MEKIRIKIVVHNVKGHSIEHNEIAEILHCDKCNEKVLHYIGRMKDDKVNWLMKCLKCSTYSFVEISH